ncbi:MAG: alpha/beta hydrolase [Balneolaceae bacterium]|nr:alpha/beta hydrolase [Balneolaceae bacterium]
MFGNTQFSVRNSDGYRFIDRRSADKSHPVLVMLHGMFGGLSNFDPLIEYLDDYPVFVPEIPVYDFDRAALSIPELSRWVCAVLEKQDIREPVLLGNSMGGHIALDLALRFPKRVKALVLTGSSGLFENDFGSTRPRRYDRSYVKERASLTFYDDLVNESIIDEILEVLQSTQKLGRLLSIARSTHEHNLEDQLEQVKHPVLLVWGEEDVITPPEVAETFCKKLPNAELKWIPRCGHAPMMERPQPFAFYLNEFLSKLENQSLGRYPK